MIVVTGAGQVVLGGAGNATECDPRPLLRDRKSRKYLGLQDDMAVVGVGRALEVAGLGRDLGERAGLYVAVGYIPFLSADIEPVLEGSLDRGRFSMARFSADGYTRAHPLVAFRCLPNMPAYHVSQCFNLQGPYVVTYPGPAQTYQMLETACEALEAGEIDVAVVGGVAAQRNFLVEHHYARMDPPVAADALRDAAAFLVLERRSRAAERSAKALCALEHLELQNSPFDPRERWPTPAQRGEIDGVEHAVEHELGAAALPAAVAGFVERGGRQLQHSLRSRDGIFASSRWIAES